MKSTKTFLFAAVAISFILGSSASAYYQVIDLGTLGGNQSFAYSINDNGQIVGGAYDSYFEQRACLFDSTGGGVMTLAAGPSWAYSINDNGQIVGRSAPRACLFDPTGGGANIDLGTLSGYPASEAKSINNNGQIVGYVWGRRVYYDTYERTCLFDPTGGGVNINLGTLGGKFFSRANSINNTGQIVGWALNTSENQRACLFDPTGGGANKDLGPGLAWSINDSGQIVGISSVGATLFDPTGQGNNIDLNTLIDPSSGWLLYNAYSINNEGWIVGWGYITGAPHAFLLIPEPASALLMVVGATILTLRRKKR